MYTMFSLTERAMARLTVLAIFSELNVDVDLYALIFGESVMNDAVAIVLFESVLAYAPYKTTTFSAVGFLSCVGQFFITFFGSFFIGTFTGLLTSMITKLTRLCDFPTMETSLFFLMSYSSFLLCEAAGFTGIVGILFCAITQAHYTSRNLSAESKTRVFELFETLNFLAENFVFSYIGLFLFTYDGHVWRPGFIVVSFLAIGVARLLNVFPLAGALNLGLRQKIPCKFQLMMWWAGLRGAIAFALAAEYSEGEPRRIILTTTLVKYHVMCVYAVGEGSNLGKQIVNTAVVPRFTGILWGRVDPEFKDGDSTLRRVYSFSDTLVGNETASVVINKLSEALQFDPEVFFYILLPPIIFFAGYDLKKKHFFRNIGSILMFAFVGTVISAFAVAKSFAPPQERGCKRAQERTKKDYNLIFFPCPGDCRRQSPGMMFLVRTC
eukprot:sb/3464804/